MGNDGRHRGELDSPAVRDKAPPFVGNAQSQWGSLVVVGEERLCVENVLELANVIFAGFSLIFINKNFSKVQKLLFLQQPPLLYFNLHPKL